MANAFDLVSFISRLWKDSLNGYFPSNPVFVKPKVAGRLVRFVRHGYQTDYRKQFRCPKEVVIRRIKAQTRPDYCPAIEWSCDPGREPRSQIGQGIKSYKSMPRL